MQIPYPDEFFDSLTDLLDNVDASSFLNVLMDPNFVSSQGHSNYLILNQAAAWITPMISKIDMGKKTAMFLPAPLRYQYDKREWWSIYTNKTYEKSIRWYRRMKHWPLFPVLLDNVIITLRTEPSVRRIKIFKIWEFFKISELCIGIIGKLKRVSSISKPSKNIFIIACKRIEYVQTGLLLVSSLKWIKARFLLPKFPKNWPSDKMNGGKFLKDFFMARQYLMTLKFFAKKSMPLFLVQIRLKICNWLWSSPMKKWSKSGPLLWK